jgi:hypothetical protein
MAFRGAGDYFVSRATRAKRRRLGCGSARFVLQEPQFFARRDYFPYYNSLKSPRAAMALVRQAIRVPPARNTPLVASLMRCGAAIRGYSRSGGLRRRLFVKDLTSATTESPALGQVGKRSSGLSAADCTPGGTNGLPPAVVQWPISSGRLGSEGTRLAVPVRAFGLAGRSGLFRYNRTNRSVRGAAALKMPSKPLIPLDREIASSFSLVARRGP